MNPKFLLMTAFSIMVILLISGCINEEKTKAERGSTIIEKVELSEDEKAKQANLIANIPEDVKRDFNTRYGAWKETWNEPPSNLR